MSELVYFIQNFFDQSPPPSHEGLRRQFRKYSTVEEIVGTAIGVKKESKCILYPSGVKWSCDHGFVFTTFLGMEFDLLIHDILAFNYFDLLFDNTAVSALCTYLIHLFRSSVRTRWGKYNISRNTSIDHRFLS